MKEKVVEILIYLMSEIQDNKELNEIDLGDLRNRGYTPSEISAAFTWLYENLPAGEGTSSHAIKFSPGSRRVLHDAERYVLSTDGQGYLIQLHELGLLDDKDLENVIERAMMSGDARLTLSDVREIVTAVLFAKGRTGPGGHRSMPSDEDTVH